MGFNPMTTPEHRLSQNTDLTFFNLAPEPLAVEAVLLPTASLEGQIDAARRTLEELDVIPKAVQTEPLLTRTRASRLDAESQSPSDHPIHRFMRKPILWEMTEVSAIVEWGIELFPLRFIWGPGDILSLYMGLKNKNPLTGEKIDQHEARLHVIAACIPFLPSKAIIGPARMIRSALEEGHHAIHTGDINGIKGAITKKNALKIALLYFS